MPKIWVINNSTVTSDTLIKSVKSPILAKLLLSRGIDTPEKAEKFLNPLSVTPVSPYAYKDMEIAVQRIKRAIENQEHILVYGDFDADGVTSTAVMFKTLTHLGAKFSYHIPDRALESHGIKSKIILTKIAKEKVKLIITVDCGISDLEQISLAKTYGVDVIVTDHHEAKYELPKAIAILDAKAPNSLREDLCVEDIESLASMAGVGVAFKLSCALLEEYGQISFTEQLLPLVAVGTIADVMPLLHENRLFVALGLKLIQEDKNQGLTALLNSAGVSGEEKLTAEKIAFSVAPRINAAGRLDSADTAFKLLITDNPAEIMMATQSLNNYNKLRQELSDEIFAEAVEYIEKNNLTEDSAIVAYGANWHIGIIGIVASKLVEKFNRPVFMFTESADSEGYRCSARSLEGVNIFEVLEQNADIIESFGGHSMAAGLSLLKTQTTLEKFKESVNRTIYEMTGGESIKPVLNIDLEVDLTDLSEDLLTAISRMEPFGEGNPYPIFATKALTLTEERTVGQNRNHLKFSCMDKSHNTADCVFWNNSTLGVPIGKSIDIAFVPKINEFNGIRTIQLDIKDYNSEDFVAVKQVALKVIDHRKKTGILAQVADYIKNSENSFKIFAEDKEIVKSISEYDELLSNVFTRLNPEKADQLMFFDYPSDKGLMEYVLKSSAPKIVHFMNYHTPQPDVDALITKVSGMLKYASKAYNGEVYLAEIASALSISDELTKLIIKVLNRTGVIRVNDYNRGKISFDFLEPASVAKIKASEFYEDCRMELFKSKNYRDGLVEASNLSEYIKRG